MRKYRYRKDFTVDGKRYTVRADTKKELIEKEIQKRVQIETAPPVSSSMTLRSVWTHTRRTCGKIQGRSLSASSKSIF